MTAVKAASRHRSDIALTVAECGYSARQAVATMKVPPKPASNHTIDDRALHVERTLGSVIPWLPVVAALFGACSLWWWLTPTSPFELTLRRPGLDHAAGGDASGSANPVQAGKVLKGPGTRSDLPGGWSGFRGSARDGLSSSQVPLAKAWNPGAPKELWSVELGEGYAGPAVAHGCVYVMDYDRERKQDAIRCLSLADGQEIWRYGYPVAVKRNHGMSRTVPSVTDKLVVTMGPKCHVACLDAADGGLRWGLDLVRQFGATVPPWYAGQCPLVDRGAVILAPGGKDVLMLAVDAETGKVLWQTPNPHGWKMTHSSIMPMEIGGERSYIYCASLGVVGVSARDGRVLWETTDWKISIATVPSPTVVDAGRILLSGGYNAGSLMLQIEQASGKYSAKPIFKLDSETFGATQHTPILYQGHFYGVRPDGQFVCLDVNGKVLWTSGPGQLFNLGSFLLADGLIFALNDSGLLSLVEATPERFHRLAQAQVLKGRESWAPMALADDRLLARDLTRMVCLDVGAH